MKNKCLRIFLLVVITLMLLNITVYAEGQTQGVIDTSYKEDTNYAMKIKYNGSERDAGIVLTHSVSGMGFLENAERI